MHPFRSNQFNFTEISPFPEIKYPLEIGKKLTDELRITDGWGDWSHTSGHSEYQVVSIETVNTNYGSIDDCWHIKSKSRFPFGESILDFWFNDSLGFVKKEYVNYGEQTLSIELEKVLD